MKKFVALAVAARALGALGDAPQPPDSAAPPLVLTNARVSLDARKPPVLRTVVLEGGRIAFVGSEADARKRAPHARVIELPGAVIYPGWTDAHGHLLGLGELKENLELRGKSRTEILRIVAERVSRTSPGAWIKGRGWDQNLWPGTAFPTAAELSAVSPANPVVLQRVDGHALWVNGLAIERARAAAKGSLEAPAGGRIEKDPSGAPAGVFVDNATDLVTRAIPVADDSDRSRWFESAFAMCARSGLTGVGDASSYDRRSIEVLRVLSRTKKMPIRVYATIGARDPDIESFLSAGRIEEGLLTVRAVKMYADGALGSRGAALLDDYADEPGNRGLLLTPAAEMERMAERCFRAGWQIWTHAIGDRGNRMTLDAYAEALSRVRPKDPRPRIEHAQVVAVEDLPRWSRLGVIASIQATHATSDMGWAEARLGPRRIGGAYAWRKFLDSKIRLCGGSDFPIESEDPRLGFYAAVTRQNERGEPAGGWRSGEVLTRAEALRLLTMDNAYAQFAESRRGRIAAGLDADLTVLDRDVLTISASEIPRMNVLMTIVAGEIVHRMERVVEPFTAQPPARKIDERVRKSD